MSWTVDVRVEPDGPAEAGGTVWLWVRAEPTEPAQARALHCEVSWATGGRGTPDSAVVFGAKAAGGEAAPGRPLTAEFQVALPAQGPISYSGRLIAIGWQVRVWVDLAWAQDPVRVVPLQVVPRRS